MKRILVGYDKSVTSEKALSLAIELSGKMEFEIVVAFVRSKYDLDFMKDSDITDIEAKKQVKEMIKDAVKTVIKSGIKVEGVILKGDPALKIMEYAEDKDIDLIILGATGIGDVGRYKLGGVAEKVTRYSKKPVLIAR